MRPLKCEQVGMLLAGVANKSIEHSNTSGQTCMHVNPFSKIVWASIGLVKGRHAACTYNGPAVQKLCTLSNDYEHHEKMKECQKSFASRAQPRELNLICSYQAGKIKVTVQFGDH